MQSKLNRGYPFWIVVFISVLLLSLATVYAQVNDLSVRFIRIQQEKVHLQMMGGVAGNPWQYRILADWMISFLITWVNGLDIAQPELVSFIAFRFLQCVLIFLVAAIYYRKLGLSLLANLLGLSVLAWGMSYALYNSDLSFNNYFDVAFYLIAANLIVSRTLIWIIPLMVIASFNRETSALIPIMALTYTYFGLDGKAKLKSALFPALAGIVIFVIIFAGLRYYYGEQMFLTADGFYPGFGLFYLNLKRVVTWEQLFITFGLLPLLAILAYSEWPQSLKIFFWTVVPLWMAIHFFSSLVAETRLLLVPYALVFIPGVLFGIMSHTPTARQDIAEAKTG